MQALPSSVSAIVLAAGILFVSIDGSMAGVTDEDILNGAKRTDQVVTYGIGPQGQRFSPLDKVNTQNVKQLVPAWAFSFGGEKQHGQESQALVYDGIVYVTGSYSRLFAINARTGEKVWQYDARLPEGILPCCDVINRGAALYGDLVYFGTLISKIVALDRKTGKVVWNKRVDDYQEGYTITAAPIVVKGKIITANAGGEFGVVGKVRALDAKTGEIVWERPTIEGHMGMLNGKPSTMTGKLNASWPGDMWKTGGGAPGIRLLTIRTSICSTPAPAIRLLGTRICGRATIFIRPRSSPSIRTPARSPGTCRQRLVTAGTSMRWPKSCRSTCRWTARR